jgi:hypothetical protein
VQLTTDGHHAYLEAVSEAFGTNIDFAQLVKIYGYGTIPQKRPRQIQPPALHQANKWFLKEV